MRIKKAMNDAEFVKLGMIPKKYAARMKKIANAMNKAATQGEKLEEEMTKEFAKEMAKETGALFYKNCIVPDSEITSLSCLPDFPNQAQVPISFDKVRDLSSHLLTLASAPAITIIPKDKKADYAREKYDIPDFGLLPADWNPATHYKSDDFRPITPSWPPRDPAEYETPDGSWVVPAEAV